MDDTRLFIRGLDGSALNTHLTLAKPFGDTGSIPYIE